MRRAFLGPTLALAVLAGCTTPPVGPDPAPADAPSKAAPSPEPAPKPEPVEPEPETDPSGGYDAAGDLYYMEVVTGGADKDARLPMIVAIHGLGDEPRGFVGLLGGLQCRGE